MIQILSPQSTKVTSKSLKPRPVLQMSWDVVERIATWIGQRPAESGGAFGGAEGQWDVTSFHFDKSSRTSAATYSPDYEHLNRLFKTEWKPSGIRLRGFVHSHPGLSNRPSHGDEIYAEQILKGIPDMKLLWLPIVNTVPDTGEFTLTPWGAVLRDGKLQIIRGALAILDLPQHTKATLAGLDAVHVIEGNGKFSELRIPGRRTSKSRSITGHQLEEEARADGASPRQPVGDTFERVKSAYDLPRMNGSRIVAIGTGGAAEWLEQLGRAGVGQFVLIDPDTVSETNLATQQVYRRDIGRAKVDCIAERIRDINPEAKVLSLKKSLDDISDSEFAELANGTLDGESATRTLLCGLTDNFFAQARVNRLALHLGLPSLSGQVYREGRGCEITFTYPGVTPACHRCILSSRYRYFLEQKQENSVTSHGTPIFATSRLNATKGFIALALLHHGSDHTRWGSMLERIGDRNFVVARMDPDFATTIGMRSFDRVFEGADKDRIFFDEAIWLPQKPESPATGHEPCPDCGGTGDLQDSIGKISTTDLRDQPHESSETHKGPEEESEPVESLKCAPGEHFPTPVYTQP